MKTGFACAFVMMAAVCAFGVEATAPDGLTTEYRQEAFGLGTMAPRLGWRLPLGTVRQTAYEIEADGRACGKVLSDAQFNVLYPGKLGPRTRTQWRVRTWDENGKVSDWSRPATFSVANLTATDWGGARWIGTSDAQPPAFVKRFSVKGPVREATLAVSAAGFYEASLNGARVGDKLLDPGFFDYDKRMLFSAYPLERQLKAGENELKVMLGHAWYDVRSSAAWDFNVARWRDRPKFILNLDIVYADGSHETVVSDESWTTAPSPIVYDDIRDGEFIDPSAAAPSSPVRPVTPPKGALVAVSHPATRVLAERRPVSVRRCADGRIIVDFGLNLAGWMRLRLRNVPKGRVVTVRYDERLTSDGLPSVPSALAKLPNGRRDLSRTRHVDEHLRVPGSTNLLGTAYQGFQTDRYTATGTDGETYEPRFTYNGFRYVVITGLDEVPDAKDLTAVEIGTDFRKTGSFRCSDETFNKLIEATDRSYRSNFTVGVPTDCPHREKNGWTGDAQLASELAQYYYENTSAYEKWVRDLVDSQNEAGDIPGIVPTASWGFKWGNGPGWDAALTAIPWNLYCYRGDVRVLEEAYPAIRRYLAFTAGKATDGLVRHGLGDWCPVDRKHMPTFEYSSSLYYYQAQRLAAQIAAVLNRPDEASAYAEGAKRTREAIVARYRRGDGVWDNGRQTAQAMALGFGIVPADEIKATEEKLVAAVQKEGGQADFGIFGAKTVFRALSNAGRADLAFQLAAGHGKHQFGSWIDQGATSLWETWNADCSLNHIMYGDFAAWACQYLAGIRLAPAQEWADMIPVPTKTAFREMLIAPTPIDALSFAEADIETPYGRVFSRWERDGGKIRYRVTLPPGTTALFRAPGLAERKLCPGNHEFSAADGRQVEAMGRQYGFARADVAAPLGEHALSGLKERVGYFAPKPLEQGDDGRLAVVIVPDGTSGAAVPPEAAEFAAAVRRRTGGSVPYVVVPVFPRQAGGGRAWWTDWAGGGDAVGTELSSLDVLDVVIRRLNDRNRFLNLSRVVVAGAGAGGQLASLYAAVGRGRDSNGLSFSFASIAPAALFRPETDLPWPRGLGKAPRYVRNLTREDVCDYLWGRRQWIGCATAADVAFLSDYPEWRKFVTVRTLGDGACDAWRDDGFLDFVLDDLPRQTSPWQVTVGGCDLPLMTGRALRGVFSFASCEVKGGEEVVVTSPEGKVERFTAKGPFRRAFKPHGARNALALFGDAPETDVPDRSDPKVKWFGPGEHRAGAIRLTDGETLYLAPGAVVHGALYAQGRDITVTGRGVLTGVDYPRCHGPYFFFTTFQGCTNLVIRGVTLTEPYHWTLALFDCEKVLIEDVRICAGNMLNDDAIDPTNCRDVTIRGVFARAQDDIVALKGMQACPRERRTPCENFLIEDCTFWSDMANVFRIGYECNASHFANFTARNIDVVGYAVLKKPWQNTWPNVVFFMQPSNGMAMRDFLFEDIRVHSDGHDNLLVLAEPRLCGCFFPNGTGNPYDTTSYLDKYTTGGSVDGLTFRNVSVEGVRGAYRGEIVVRGGRSAAETVRNVRFENVTRFGERVTASSPDVLVENAENVTFP